MFASAFIFDYRNTKINTWMYSCHVGVWWMSFCWGSPPPPPPPPPPGLPGLEQTSLPPLTHRPASSQFLNLTSQQRVCVCVCVCVQMQCFIWACSSVYASVCRYVFVFLSVCVCGWRGVAGGRGVCVGFWDLAGMFWGSLCFRFHFSFRRGGGGRERIGREREAGRKEKGECG